MYRTSRKKMIRMLEEEQHRLQLCQRASVFVKRYSWDQKEDSYFELVDRLIGEVSMSRALSS